MADVPPRSPQFCAKSISLISGRPRLARGLGLLEIDRGTTSLDATGTSQAEEGVKKPSFGEASLRHPYGGARAATRATPGKGFFHMFGRGGRQWIFR